MVDDDAEVRELLRVALTGDGYDVARFASPLDRSSVLRVKRVLPPSIRHTTVVGWECIERFWLSVGSR